MNTVGVEGEKVVQMEKVASTYLLGMRWIAGEKVRSCWVAQGAQSGAL